MRRVRVSRRKKKARNVRYVKMQPCTVQVIDILKDGIMLPPPSNVCQTCAVDHHPELPHNCQSLFFQYTFYRQHSRWPSWIDAMAHCTPAMQESWRAELSKRGQDLEHGGIQ